MQRAKRAALTRRAERLCAERKARNDAVLERLGLSTHDVTLPSPQPPAFPRRSTKSPPRGRRLGQMSPERSDDEEDDSFWDTVLLGGQMAALACEEARVVGRDKSPSASTGSVYSFGSLDTRMPSELGAISLIGSSAEVTNFKPTPPPPPPRAAPLSRRRASRLPVFSARLSGAGQFSFFACFLLGSLGVCWNHTISFLLKPLDTTCI